uniref:Single domain-containing protein n=1 Tax=Clastoptera arizonana TaxID=38151 RepID=A0A1B6D205_9HEMI
MAKHILLVVLLIFVSTESYRVRRTRVATDGNDNCVVNGGTRAYLETWTDTNMCNLNICISDDISYIVETLGCPNFPVRYFAYPCSEQDKKEDQPWPQCCKKLYCF